MQNDGFVVSCGKDLHHLQVGLGNLVRDVVQYVLGTSRCRSCYYIIIINSHYFEINNDVCVILVDFGSVTGALFI